LPTPAVEERRPRGARPEVSAFLLIAEREFRAYVATFSFWIALAVGPLAMAGAVALAHFSGAPQGPVRISIETPDPGAWRSAAAAVREAASLEGRAIDVLPRGDASGAATIDIPPRTDGRIDMAFVGPVPLSPTGRALVRATMERDAALTRLHESLPARPSGLPPAAPSPPPAVNQAAARFGLVMALWLTLTGSLGMLLQAVVRERANRALESLLASARPADIVAGKIAGVGAVSLLVLSTWLGAGALLAPLAPQSAGLGLALWTALASPLALARAILVYVLAFAFYGLVTVALGARARDSAEAQNLARPMFAVLLAVFFAALLGAGRPDGALAWLAFAPPFTPFMLLMSPPGAFGPLTETVALTLLAAATLLAGKMAVRRLDLASPPKPIPRLRGKTASRASARFADGSPSPSPEPG
jgi:ABC-2 type transport system permease protein